ncbi:MAG: DUF362 domain-containing protein [Parabacteroides sp.]|jgi:uncharacterized protein (DUF362 family)|uniref:Tat (Twin-arginine translocation) pathway signal sequence n=3 Tax=root TaxID=1 RepID=A0A1T5BXZ7_9BACT|nr:MULTISPECIES: DUF362 domain-containing protein [Bacteroidales]MBP7919954.1 DUF362 domain-containing protein [Parabacteroides sp.]MDT3368857.1 DUF362 domain-containing protein [Bacteroidota bacterium]OCW93245.1 tat (twin-arginine translocation) pathway signal sequence [Macellibacteroides sp. HH-ZS]HAD01310.1 DUF362 domain-containing protein [Porphyromonadaceae bacterium]MBP7954567.1 DUF362 domain-containing protein [Parabacteroides sp.]
MKRRDFLKTSAVAGAALSLNFDGLQAALSSNTVAVEKAPDLVAVMGGEPAAMLDKALEALGGIGKFVKKGQKVVIKPNIGWDRAPEMAGNTNPELVAALVKKCLGAGAQKVTVFDHTCDNWQKCYETSGISDAVKKAGGIMMPGNDEKYYKEVAIPGGVTLKNAKIHESLIEADVWINVPVLKNHGGAKLTCAMKNYMGIVWDRRYFHSNDLQQCIADICTWNKKPVLNIVDAYRIMHKNGPQGKSLSDVAQLKTLIASTNIVATDTAALRFFNQVEKLDISAVGHIGKGEALKLGTSNLDKLTIKRIKI